MSSRPSCCNAMHVTKSSSPLPGLKLVSKLPSALSRAIYSRVIPFRLVNPPAITTLPSAWNASLRTSPLLVTRLKPVSRLPSLKYPPITIFPSGCTTIGLTRPSTPEPASKETSRSPGAADAAQNISKLATMSAATPIRGTKCFEDCRITHRGLSALAFWTAVTESGKVTALARAGLKTDSEIELPQKKATKSSGGRPAHRRAGASRPAERNDHDPEQQSCPHRFLAAGRTPF